MIWLDLQPKASRWGWTKNFIAIENIKFNGWMMPFNLIQRHVTMSICKAFSSKKVCKFFTQSELNMGQDHSWTVYNNDNQFILKFHTSFLSRPLSSLFCFVFLSDKSFCFFSLNFPGWRTTAEFRHKKFYTILLFTFSKYLRTLSSFPNDL